MFDKQTRVLVADDSLVVRRSIKNMFKEIEFTNVDEAKDGQQAYDKILAATEANEDYGLIISDINMPNMDGLDPRGLRTTRISSRALQVQNPAQRPRRRCGDHGSRTSGQTGDRKGVLNRDFARTEPG